MEWMTEVSAVVSAIAAVVVAVFSISTWRLYRREVKRDNDSRGLLAAHVYKLHRDFSAFADVLEEVDELDSEQIAPVVRQWIPSIRSHQEFTAELIRKAEPAPLTFVAHLEAATLKLREAGPLLEEIADELMGELEAPHLIGELKERVRSIGESFQRAYLSIPAKNRTSGDTKESYDQLLERAYTENYGARGGMRAR